MKWYNPVLLTIFITTGSLAEEQSKPAWLMLLEKDYGVSYRLSVSNIIDRSKTDKNIEQDLVARVRNGVLDTQARIILERIRQPKVFADCEQIIREFRTRGEYHRRGLLSGRLMDFTKQGAESKFVDLYELDQKGQIKLSAHTNATKKASGMRATFKKVEKYTDEEVRAGISRNSAARYAVLEHALRFFAEGSTYEQCEIIDVVYELWGSTHLGRHSDNEPLAEDLIEPIYKDESLPLVVRYTAMTCLPSVKLGDYQGFLLNAVKKSMMEEKTPLHEDVLYRVLERLKKTADTSTLATLKGMTNGSPQKVEMLRDATRKIEIRLSK